MKLFYIMTGMFLILMTTITLTRKPEPIIPPCSVKPCIKITESDGKVFLLNDFRFMPNHCIAYVSLPNNDDHVYCGDYKLDWIGPEHKL